MTITCLILCAQVLIFANADTDYYGYYYSTESPDRCPKQTISSALATKGRIESDDRQYYYSHVVCSWSIAKPGERIKIVLEEIKLTDCPRDNYIQIHYKDVTQTTEKLCDVRGRTVYSDDYFQVNYRKDYGYTEKYRIEWEIVDKEDTSQCSTACIVGIASGIGLLLVIIGNIVYCFTRKRNVNHRNEDYAVPPTPPPKRPSAPPMEKETRHLPAVPTQSSITVHQNKNVGYEKPDYSGHQNSNIYKEMS